MFIKKTALMALSRNKKIAIWVIIAIIIVIAIIFFYKKNQESQFVLGEAAVPTPDYLKNLSPQDLAAYNDLPDQAAKDDFLRILQGQNKIPAMTSSDVMPSTNNSSTGNQTPTDYSQVCAGQIKAAQLSHTGIKFLDNIINRIRNKNYKPYTQVPPIDENCCDANGYNAIGVKCDIGY